MNIPLLIKAAESMDEAKQFTINQAERDSIQKAIYSILDILAKRGVFIGTSAPDEPPKATADYPATPELDKMKTVHDNSQAIGEFLDVFLAEKGFHIGKPHRHTSQCAGWDDNGRRIRGTTNDCHFHTGEFQSINTSIENLLAEFFGIDLKKVEQERRAVLEYIRREQENPTSKR